MSEKPRESAYSRLEAFEANKVAHEAEQERLAQENYVDQFYGEAGKTDFSDEAKTQLEELDNYERERVYANLPDEVADTPEAREAYYDRQLWLDEGEIKENVDPVVEEAYKMNDEETAYKMQEEFEANRRAEERAAAIEADPRLRRMNNMAGEIARLRARTNHETAEADAQRVDELEERLNDLLIRYEGDDDYNVEYADELLNRTQDEDLERENSEKARSRTETEPESNEETPVVWPEADPDKVIDWPETDPDKTVVWPETDPDHVDEVTTEGGLDDDLEEVTTTHDLGEDLDEVTTYGELGTDDDRETGTDTEKGFFGRLKARFNVKERWNRLDREQKKLTKKAIGAVAIAGVIIAGAIVTVKGIGDGTAVQAMADSMNNGNKNPLPSGDGWADILPSTVPDVDVLPNSIDFSYPWDWASEAVGEDKAMDWLHELSDKAANAGHEIEWHGSGAQEWVSIDGNSNTQDVLDVLRQYA